MADWSAIPVPVPYANLTNPQTLNLYAMVRDNPETFADLDGHAAPSDTSSGSVTYGPASQFPGASPGASDQNKYANKNDKAKNQVPPEVKAAIKDAVKASNSPTADDKRGGFHEEGGIYGKDANGKVVVVPAKPGPYSDPTVPGGTAHIDVGNSVNPGLKDTLVSVDGTYHVHPGGVVEPSNGKPGGNFVQPPSEKDKSAASTNTNIVVGARNKRVYFYNSSGVTRETSLKKFEKEP